MLSRRWLINAVLVVVIAALAWLGLRVDDVEDAASSQRISELTPSEVNRIEITAPGLALALRRETGGWLIERPILWPANAGNIKRLLGILEQAATPVADASSTDAAALGLQPPAASWLLDDTRLDFGAINPIGERRYLLVNSKLYLLPDVHLAFATQGLPGMVDRRLLPRSDEIARLRLPAVDIVRDDTGEYRAADRPQLASQVLAELVENWRSLPANGIRAFDLDANPGELISLRLASGEELDFLLQSREPEIVIANPQIGLQYHFRGDFREQLIAPRDGG